VVVSVEEARVGVVQSPGSSQGHRTIQLGSHTHLKEARVLEWLQVASLPEHEPK
jgi:urease beta subunit